MTTHVRPFGIWEQGWMATFMVVATATILTACGDDPGKSVDDGGVDAALDASADADTVPPTPSTDWCDRVAPGPAAETSIPEGLSAVHAAARFFGTESADGATIPYVVVGEALAAALDRQDPWTPASLTAFADALESVCALEVTDVTLQPASVELVGDVALITPGTGPVTLPPGTNAVAVDLRELPNVPGLWEALEAAIAPALATPVPRLDHGLRQQQGLIDELFSDFSVYTGNAVRRQPPDLAAEGSADLPLALLTGPVMAPAAAELAITLRAASRAWIIGEDVLTHVAEARWYGVNDTHGAVVHVRSLYKLPIRMFDVVPADERHVDPTTFLPRLSAAGFPGTMTVGATERPELLPPEAPFGKAHPPAVTPGAIRAALLSAHGALRLFFPYFHVVGDTIDERLAELIAVVDGAGSFTRMDAYHWLWRFGETIRDSHMYASDTAPDAPLVGCMPVLFEHLDDEIVVGRSETVDLAAGDTITSIDGEASADWLARWWPIIGAAADGFHARNILLFKLVYMYGSRTLEVRDPDGLTRTVTITPGSCSNVPYLREPRAAGYLTEVGAPNLYYLNLDSEVLAGETQMRQALVEASGASGMVLDLRGYPGIDHYEMAARLVDSTIGSMWFRVPGYVGPDDFTIDESHFTFEPQLNPHYHGPVVLLIGPRSVSAAENFSIMLMDADRFEAVVGRQSGASNGNITGLNLPGGFTFSFTGMEVQHVDHSTFHGIGVVPDVEVIPTPTELRDGIDPELEAAVNILLNLP